jgi:Bacterial protein of unknown function (DUF937)
MSIISEVMRFLTPQIIDRIAILLGIDSPIMRKLVAAAVPAIVGGLAKLVASPGGLQKLAQTLDKEPENPLEKLEAVLTGKGAKTAATGGFGTLENLLGNKTAGELAGALAGFGGAKATDSKSLLGLIAPAVMGTLANKRREGLDTKELASRLLAEKKEIARAMPEGFGDYLKGDLANEIGLDLPDEKLASVVRTASATATARVPTTTAKSSGRSWIVPLLIVAALGLFAWYYFSGRPAEQAAQAPPATSVSGFSALEGVEVGGANLASTLQTSIDGIRSALEGISDEASAKAALPALSNYSGQLEGLANGVDLIPAEARTALSAALASVLPAINELIDKVLAIPGVEAAVGPTVTSIRQHLDTLAKV